MSRLPSMEMMLNRVKVVKQQKSSGIASCPKAPKKKIVPPLLGNNPPPVARVLF